MYKRGQKLTYDMVLKLKRYDRIRAENIRLRKCLLQGCRYGAKLGKLLRGLYVK